MMRVASVVFVIFVGYYYIIILYDYFLKFSLTVFVGGYF